MQLTDLLSENQEPTTVEKRFLKLWDYATNHKDVNLQSALGVITTDYIEDKSALPLSVYRLRKIVNQIKSKANSQIPQLRSEFAGVIRNYISPIVIEQIVNKKLTKLAEPYNPPVFRKARD